MKEVKNDTQVYPQKKKMNMYLRETKMYVSLKLKGIHSPKGLLGTPY